MNREPGEDRRQADAIHDFLASTHVFAAAVSDEIEEELLEQAGGKDLTPSQLKLLKLVSMTDAQNIGSVAAFMGVSNAAASKGVDRLVKRELLLRREHEVDRRVMHLSMTERGSQVLRAYEAARRQKLLDMFADVPADELKTASDLMDRLSLRIVEKVAGEKDICLKCGIYFRRECLMREMQGRRCLYVQLNP